MTGFGRTMSIAAIAASLALSAACHGEESALPAVATAAIGSPPVGPLHLMRHPMGDRLPDAALVDDTGRDVRFMSDLVRNHAVVISFFYTTCRGTCPGTNLVLADLRDRLATDFGRSVRMISISIEPEKDDVDAIAEYAARYRLPTTDPDTPEWVFLTGSADEIRGLRRALELYDRDPAVDLDPTQHAAAVVIGNHATGRWSTVPVGVGAERLSSQVSRVAGWTAAQRYSTHRSPPRGPDGGAATILAEQR
ncbi:MAG: SCO family protein [Planctomycetes bacterium]|nr:SCO family protein [Planctomycetota bacterium]